MNKWTELELLKKTLEDTLCGDELDTTLYYLDEFKSLKEKELTDIDRENLLKILNHFKDSMFLFKEDQENDIITKRELKKLIKKIKEE